jgi:hypothetical protein
VAPTAVGDENDHDKEVPLAPTPEPLSSPTPSPNVTTKNSELHKATTDGNSSSAGTVSEGQLVMFVVASLGVVAIVGAMVGRKNATRR